MWPITVKNHDFLHGHPLHDVQISILTLGLGFVFLSFFSLGFRLLSLPLRRTQLAGNFMVFFTSIIILPKLMMKLTRRTRRGKVTLIGAY